MLESNEHIQTLTTEIYPTSEKKCFFIFLFVDFTCLCTSATQRYYRGFEPFDVSFCQDLHNRKWFYDLIYNFVSKEYSILFEFNPFYTAVIYLSTF